MSEHHARLEWSASDAPFTYDAYDRSHAIALGSGVRIEASAAPEFRGHASRANPEELLVASASSCHMLTFLAIAARKRLVVLRYVDDAVGFLEPLEDKRLSITRIELRPEITFDGAPPDAETLEKMHEMAHRNCFIASSIRASVTVVGTGPNVG